MKKLILIFMVLMMCGNALAIEVTFTIPDEELQRVKDAFVYTYPIPLDPITSEPLYTVNQWVKEVIKDFVKNKVLRFERRVAMDDAKDTIERDEDIIQ